MKKFLVLIGAAAVIGIAISSSREPGAQGQPEQESAPTSAAAPAEPGTPPEVSGERGVDSSKVAEATEEEGKSTSDTADATNNQERDTETARTPTAIYGQPAPKSDDETKATSDASDAAESRPTDSPTPEAPSLRRGVQLARKGNQIKARKILTQVYLEAPPAIRKRARKTLKSINAELVFDPRVLDGATVHTVQSGETLGKIGKKYGVNWRMIQLLNGISRPGLIRVNQRLKILPGPQKILVDKSDFRLALFIDGVFIKEYPVGLGKNDKTPTGTFDVEEMLIEPDWYPPEGGIIKYGEEGHLIGDRWIGLSDQPGAIGLGIHGTSDPESIGTMCSNGCIRMHNKDVKELYKFLKTGATVTITE